MLMRIIGALLITYFLSRGLRRLGLTHPPVGKLVLAHVLSLGIAALAVIAIRQPVHAYEFSQLYVYAFAQLFWLLVDSGRAAAVLWKPPKPKATAPSPTAPD